MIARISKFAFHRMPLLFRKGCSCRQMWNSATGSSCLCGGLRDSSYVSLENLGKERLGALRDPKIGPYSRKPLDRQYFIVPRSAADSYGPAFIGDLESRGQRALRSRGSLLLRPSSSMTIVWRKRLPAQASAVLGAVEAAASAARIRHCHDS